MYYTYEMYRAVVLKQVLQQGVKIMTLIRSIDCEILVYY